MIVALMPLCLWAVIHLPIGSAGVHQWLPQHSLAKQSYDRFIRDFGNDQVVLVTWENCRVDDVRLHEFRLQLEQADNQLPKLFLDIENSSSLLNKLVEPPLKLARADAEKRLRGFMLGADGTAATLVYVSLDGVQHQSRTIKTIFEAADKTPGLGAGALKLAGSVYEAFAVDRSAADSLTQLVLPSSLLGMVVAWMALRGWRQAAVVLFLAGFGQVLAIALVFYTGQRFSAVLIVLPTLVFMLSLSGAVHLVNYYFACEGQSSTNPGYDALRVGWRPCSLSSFTTMLGMGSLVTSQLVPVRQFGIYSAVGLGLSTAALLLAFPSVSTIARLKQRKQSSRTGDPSQRGQWVDRYVDSLARRSVLIALLGCIALCMSGAGLWFLQTSTKFRDMFPDGSPTNQDMRWIEHHLGPIATVEVLLRFPKQDRERTFDRVRWVSRVENQLRRLPIIGGTASATTFLPAWSESGSLGSVVRRAALRRALENNYSKLLDNKMVAETDQSQTWRILAKVSATSEVDYGTLTRAIVSETRKAIDTGPREQVPQTEFTGLFPVLHETQQTLLIDLAISFLTAFVLITPIMMLISRSILGGLLIMIPNVLPISIAFGSMGWLGLELDIAGILTASIALGIAVDDTLHFTCWYMNALHTVRSQLEAVRETFVACAGAMLHTTLIACLSMAPFLFAEFVPTQQFARLMIVILVGAVVGDLVLLPALLLCPLGKSALRCR